MKNEIDPFRVQKQTEQRRKDIAGGKLFDGAAKEFMADMHNAKQKDAGSYAFKRFGMPDNYEEIDWSR